MKFESFYQAVPGNNKTMNCEHMAGACETAENRG
jgi:hypothetical protein